MKRMSIILYLGILFGIFSCEEPDYPKNIYDENPEVLPNPSITSISPSDSAFSGIGIITISGENFSTSLDRNLVYFNGNSGIVQSATATELVVKTANIIADSVKIQVTVLGAYEFAGWDNYGLYSSVLPWGGFDPLGTSLWGIEVDNSENLIVSDQGDEFLYRVFANGNQDSVIFGDYGPRNRADAIRLGPNSQYYMAMNYKKIYTLEEPIPGATGTESVLANVPGNIRATSLDFDEYGNLYVGVKTNVLYKINIGNGESVLSVVDTLTEDILVTAVRVFENYIYYISEYIGSDTLAVKNGIWRNEILGTDSFGDEELVIDWKAVLGEFATKPLDITFAADGSLIVGVDYVDASSYEALGPGLYEVSLPYFDVLPVPIYEDVYKAPASKLSWGNDKYLYVNNRNTATPPEGVEWDYKPVDQLGIYRIDMDRLGAQYHGRSL